MNKTMIASAVAMTVLAGAALAEAPKFSVYSEYGVETKTAEFGAAAAISLNDKLTVTPEVVATGDSSNFAFDHAAVTVNYAVATNLDVYGRIESDSDFAYDNTYVGVALRF